MYQASICHSIFRNFGWALKGDGCMSLGDGTFHATELSVVAALQVEQVT